MISENVEGHRKRLLFKQLLRATDPLANSIPRIRQQPSVVWAPFLSLLLEPQPGSPPSFTASNSCLTSSPSLLEVEQCSIWAMHTVVWQEGWGTVKVSRLHAQRGGGRLACCMWKTQEPGCTASEPVGGEGRVCYTCPMQSQEVGEQARLPKVGRGMWRVPTCGISSQASFGPQGLQSVQHVVPSCPKARKPWAVRQKWKCYQQTWQKEKKGASKYWANIA